MTAKPQHVHKYKRLRYKSGNTIFFCTLPDCNQKINIALALGKRSICWRCGQEFILNEYSIRLAKPHCDACHKPKSIQDFRGSETKLEYADEIQPAELSLSERLEQTINQAKQATEEEDEI